MLRELVHLTNGWLPLEPSFERKYALGDHVHDDARRCTKIKRRLYELRHPSDYPGSPSPELERLLDRMASPAAPPTTWRSPTARRSRRWCERCGVHLEALDPVADEPSLRLLTQLAGTPGAPPRRARVDGGWRGGGGHRRAARAPARRAARAARAGAARRAGPRRVRRGHRAAAIPTSTRELYVNGAENHVPIEPEEQRHFFHGLMDAELSAAELMARNSHEHPDMPWDFHVDMARQTWDEVRHARLHDLLMKDELGCDWGDYPVGFSYFKSIYAYDLLGRLCLFNGTSEQRAMWRHSHRRKTLMELGQERVAMVFDYLLADEVPHVHNGVRWGSHLLGGSEHAYREKVRELRGRSTRRARRRARRRAYSSSSCSVRPRRRPRRPPRAPRGRRRRGRGLEGLEQLVAPGLVDRHLVGDQHPVGALELLQVEDLAVDRGRVVHDRP